MDENSKAFLAERIRALEGELSNRQVEISLLKETSDAVSSQLNLEKLLQLVAERAQRLIQAETLLIPILTPDCDEYTYRAGCGKNAEEIVGQSLPLEFGICGWVWRNRRPWWLGVLEELEPEERNKWEHEARSVILVPLIGKRHFLGGLAGINKVGAGGFDKRDLDLLSMFANQVSIAVENAGFFEELTAAKNQAESYQQELKRLYEELEKRVEERTSELESLNKQLQYLALHDPLTGLPNRSLIQDRVQQGVFAAGRESKSLAVMMMDLDRFKEVNDTLGHHVGDQLLQQVGIRLEQILRKTDTVGRLGGDEFAVIAPGAGADAALVVAAKILKILEPPFDLDHHRVSVSASLGISIFPDHGRDVPTLMKRADHAMYIAKRAQDGTYVYQSNDVNDALLNMDLLGDLRHALNNNEFRLYYQPKVDPASRRMIGVEALARWAHPQMGLLPPKEFIPVLERTGLIKPFTQWVLDTALGQCDAWRKAGIDLTVSINLSMRNLRDPQLPDHLSTLLRKWNIPRDILVLEITESAAMSDPQSVLEFLSLFQPMGIQFAIDDFGTGYSSLSHLRKLPVQEIKIDRSFVMDMARDKDAAVIVHSIVDLAQNLGLRAVAEGVENKETLDSLIQWNCNLVQGYYISEPLPPENVVGFLSQTEWKTNSTKPAEEIDSRA